MGHEANTAQDQEQQGLFVTFEGIDGAGKSTHIARLVEKFQAMGREVVLTREPGGTELAEKLRNLFLTDAMTPLSETLLVFAAREDHLDKVIRPALARGAVVLCDRFTDSSWAYQGGGRKFDTSVLGQLEGWVQRGLQPDVTLWFDLPPQVAAQRLAGARQADRFEALDTRFFEDVREGYAQRAQAHAGRFLRIDANQQVEDVWLQVERSLEDKLQAMGYEMESKVRAPRP